MKTNFPKGIFTGLFSGIVTYLLCMIVYPWFPQAAPIALSCGVAFGNFILGAFVHTD